MTNYKIYLNPSDENDVVGSGFGGARHLGIIIVGNGKTVFIDGHRSGKLSIPFNPNVDNDRLELPVSNKQNPVFGNLIVETSEANTEATESEMAALGVIQLVASQGEVNDAVADINAYISSLGAGSSYTTPISGIDFTNNRSI